MRSRAWGFQVMAIVLVQVAVFAGAFGETAEDLRRPLVGAIRWDAWNAWGHYQTFLVPAMWHYRLPFYAQVGSDGSVSVRGDTQDVVDREIAYARDAGIDYWAFCWYHPEAWPPHSREMTRCLDLYRASRHVSDINYCLILLGGVHLGPKERWEETTTRLVAYFKDPSYQRVKDGRPLVFLFDVRNAITHFGSEEDTRKALTALRHAASEAGTGNPYLTLMVFNPPEEARYVEALGGDALSAYSNPPHELEARELPYEDLIERNRWFRETAHNLGVKVIPTVNTGWDFRPEADPEVSYRHPRANWNAQASPAEIAGHVAETLEWVRGHPETCEANAVIIYAWNEFNEGGWLTPTLKEGAARLDALRHVLESKSKP